MRTHLILALIAAFLLNFEPAVAESEHECPTTLGSSEMLGPPFPESENWYGSEALAVMLPADGRWATTREDALIAVKLFWWSSGFEPGMEKHLTVELRNLGEGEDDARANRPTNAYAESLGGWTMLTGIDFPTPGCWEIKGEYLGQTLTFVVKVVDVDAYLRERREAR